MDFLRLYLLRTARLSVVVTTAGALAACASLDAPEPPQAASVAAEGRGLFKVARPYGVEGGRRTIWYLARQQPRYEEIGLASWHEDAFVRARTDGAGLSGVTAGHTALPVPSIVEVTNLATSKSIEIRVDDRAPMTGRVIDLSEAAARELGFDDREQILVRVRYVAPVKVWREADGRRYAENTPRQRPPLPLAPAPVQYAAQTTPAPVARAELAAPKPKTAPAPKPTVLAQRPATSPFHLQVGAFADPANARRVVSRLAPAGVARIEPMERRGMTLYRVVMRAGPDAEAARALKLRVAEIGFSDALVLRR